MSMLRKAFAILLCAAMAFGGAAFAAPEAAMTPGTYTFSGMAMNGPMTVQVTLTDSTISQIEVTSHFETPGIGSIAVDTLPARIVQNQSLAVDGISGATISSMVLLGAVRDCIKQAGGDPKTFDIAIEKEPAQALNLTADVIVVGGGGAGLSAAVEALDNGASVILIEKTGFLGGNSLVSGSIYNAPDPTMQDHQLAQRDSTLESMIVQALDEAPVSDAHKALMDTVRAEYEAYLASDKTLFDSPNWFALQTWNGGDKLGVLDNVKVLADNAYAGLEWLLDKGMAIEDTVHTGGGSLYPRTHRTLLPNGLGYIKALTDTLENREGLTLLMDTTGKSLILKDGRVIGVNAQGREGNAVTLNANKGVVLATGGFAGNVALRQQYCEGEKWPDLSAKLPTTNVSGVTGDGIFMARDAGAQLVNMDQIQLLPYCNPTTGMLNDVIGGADINYIFINKEGKRFVREDGRRDEMSKGIIAQTDGLMYLLLNPSTVGGDFSTAKITNGQPLSYYLDNSVAGYVAADTLDELAQKLGIPAEPLKETVASYNMHAAAKTVDEFGRVTFTGTLEDGPYCAFPRKPAAHHTMGGVRIDTGARALTERGDVVKGLYCAGEITGVVHGGNRLGGNAIVDFVVYGRIAGRNAALGL